MPVASISSWKTSPERREEFIRRLKEARAFHEKYGGKVRLWNNSVAGDSVGVIEYWIEHEDFDAYGRFSAALAKDPAYSQMFQKLTAENPAGQVVSTRLVVTVD